VLRERGVATRFNFVSDNFDPLRRVYPFLDPKAYEPLIGMPISEIPCPCGEHRSYAEHFLLPFLDSLNELRIEVEVVRADEMYKSGAMVPCIVAALESRDAIASILEELTGKIMGPEWSPFNPRCPECGRITAATVTGFSPRERTVSFECACGESGTVPMAGGGKLVWRVDWPARWKVLGVTVEPFGKDHATRGGSYDTGVRIAREVFEIEPPFPIPYEWIGLKGMGDMSASKGNVLSIAAALEIVPPEALRYMVLRERPQRKLTFDPGIPLLQLVDQVDDAGAKGRNERAIELATAGGFRPVGVPFKHLVVVAQAARFDPAEVVRILERAGYPGIDPDAVLARLGYARRWLEKFAPEQLRFEVLDTLPQVARQLTEVQRRFLGRLSDRIGTEMTGDEIHALIYDLASELSDDARPADLFQGIYLAILGKSQGPRAGWFLAVLGAEFTRPRLREASEAAV
jgi:lysyl-tRNA synthetase class 1